MEICRGEKILEVAIEEETCETNADPSSAGSATTATAVAPPKTRIEKRPKSTAWTRVCLTDFGFAKVPVQNQRAHRLKTLCGRSCKRVLSGKFKHVVDVTHRHNGLPCTRDSNAGKLQKRLHISCGLLGARCRPLHPAHRPLPFWRGSEGERCWTACARATANCL